MVSRGARIGQFGMLGAVAVVSGFAALVAWRSYQREADEFFPERQPVGMSMAAASDGLGRLESVSFRDADGATLRGWYAPATNRAAVVLLHGAGGNRASLLPEARHLAAHGFGILVFDLPGQGESDGQTHWSDGEARALVAAVDVLSLRADVDPARIGALGFSLGGAVLARVAPTEPRLRAVALTGTPSDQARQIAFEYRQWGLLSQWPARLAAERGGMRVADQRPVDGMAAIAPRPVLIVSGTQDATVPAYMADELFAAAADPRELLMVDGAGHGGYEQAPGSTYLDRLARFFEDSLLGPLA